MTFVYPLLLGGLVLAGLPVLLHFLVRQKPKTLPFPAFRFLLLKRRSNTRKLRLRHLLLMLLRIALLILVCLALARPRLFHDQFGLLSREKPVAMVLIVDTSPSMGYKSGEVSRFELAKKRSLELLDQLPEDGRVLILDTSDPAAFAREDWLKSLEKARQRIQSLTIRPGSTPVNKALDEALRRFDEWDRTGDDPAGQDLPRFVCVFSDRTTASWNSSAPALRRAKEDAVKVQMLYFDVGIDDPVDLAITQAELPANRQSFTDGEKFPLRVVVKATGKGITETNTVLVQIGGKTAVEQNFPVEAGKQQTLTLEIDTAGLGPGLHQAEVKLATPNDALSFNNVRYVTFNIHAQQNVLVLADDVKKAQKFAWALEDLRYHVQLKTVQEKTDFNGYEAVFLVGVAAPTEKLWQALKVYVEQGHGVGIIPPGEEIDRKTYNTEAAQKVMPVLILQKSGAAQAPWSLIQSDLAHPFMLPYRNWLAHGEFDFLQRPPVAYHYWEVKPLEGQGISVVVRYDEAKFPSAIVERLAKGKVLLLTTPMDARAAAWNNYNESLTSFYLALPMMCAKHLCPAPANPTLNFEFGPEPPLVTKTPAQAFPKYLLSSGDFSEEIRFDENRWVGDRLPHAGNYTVLGTNPEKQATKAIHKFSINVPGEESDLTRVPIDVIETALGKGSLVPQDRKTPLRDTLSWDEPIELFPWLMIGVLFLLALENLLANRFYRQEAEESLVLSP